MISVDTVNQTFTAIVTQDHPARSSIRPSIWPTAVLLEGNDLAFDIKAVANALIDTARYIAEQRAVAQNEVPVAPPEAAKLPIVQADSVEITETPAPVMPEADEKKGPVKEPPEE